MEFRTNKELVNKVLYDMVPNIESKSEEYIKKSTDDIEWTCQTNYDN